MKRFLLLSTCLFALLLSGCGLAASASQVTTLNVTMTDFSFSPTSWTVPAGQQVNVNLTNAGTVVHTWTIMQTPISGGYKTADQADIVFDSGAVPASSSKKVTFTAPRKPGDYQVVCIEPGHIEAGMLGLLTVK